MASPLDMLFPTLKTVAPGIWARQQPLPGDTPVPVAHSSGQTNLSAMMPKAASIDAPVVTPQQPKTDFSTAPAGAGGVTSGSSVANAALKQAAQASPNATAAAPATVVGANGASNQLGTYIDPSQTAAGQAATQAAQAAVDTQKQAALMGEKAAQGMFQMNSAAGSHLAGGLGSAAMAAAGQQQLNNINAYNSQLAAWQQGIASAQQNLGSMQAGFGQAAGQNANAALGNVQSAQAAGTPTALPTGGGGGGGAGGAGPNYASTTAQTALNTGAQNEVSALGTFASGNGKQWNAQGAASNVARKISSNISNLQSQLGNYAPGSPEYAQIAQAIQDWIVAGQKLTTLQFDSHGTYKNGQENIGRDVLTAVGKDPTKDQLPGGINIQGF